jgi:pilus assembly protein Flp/PilA
MVSLFPADDGSGQELSQPSHVRSIPMNVLKSFVKNESGATAIEYGLIAVGIAVAIISVVKAVGTGLTNTFTQVKDNLAQ